MTVSTIRIQSKMSDGSMKSKTLLTRADFLIDFGDLMKYCDEARIEDAVHRFFRKIAVPASFGLGILMMAGEAFAAEAVGVGNIHGLADKLMPLIHMVQDFALPVGITVSSWGLIEMMMGNIESGKHKMKWAIIGFIGMFLIPQVFYAIRDAFASA